MSSLGCVMSFCWYLVLKVVISALTVGICRSVCRIVFGTYRGALTVDLRALFWNRCSISMLQLLAVPQRGIPYVQMGFRLVLCIRHLFSNDSFDFLPKIQYMRWSCNPSCSVLVNMCLCHVSLKPSNCNHYLAFSQKATHARTFPGILAMFNKNITTTMYNVRTISYVSHR